MHCSSFQFTTVQINLVNFRYEIQCQPHYFIALQNEFQCSVYGEGRTMNGVKRSTDKDRTSKIMFMCRNSHISNEREKLEQKMEIENNWKPFKFIF